MSSLRTTAIFVLIALAANARCGAQGLTPEVLSSLRSSFTINATTNVMLNTITANSVKLMALDHGVSASSNSFFSHKIKTEGVTDQKNSGRCWLYAGLNLMRPIAMTSLKKKGFEFSQTYLFFYDKLEKANLFLESIIQTRSRPVDDRDVEWLLKNPFPDGGQWNMVLALIEKYGAVPSDVMPETESSGNTTLMNQLVSTRLRKNAAALRAMHTAGKSETELRTAKVDMLKDVYRMLVLHLGNPPERFTWRYEDKEGSVSEPVSYTPKEFYKKHVSFTPSDYVVLYSVPAHPFNKLYQIRYDRDCFDLPNMTFANLPIERIKEFTLKSVLADDPVWFGCDVGKESDSKLGLMKLGLYDYQSVYGVDLTMTKTERVEYQESVPSHAMVFIGVDVVNGKPEKWLVENSWGAKAGNNGLFTMYDTWFDEYMYTVIINKKYLPKDVLSIFDQTAEELPPWDPMYSVRLD
jgi:bleomycin hydrolase